MMKTAARLLASPAALAIALTGGLTLIAWLLFAPYYAVNDDVVMRLVLAGDYSPIHGPEPFVMFISILVATPIAWLYTHFSSVPWYDLTLLGTVIVATAAVAYALLSQVASTWGRLHAATVVGAAFLPFLVSITFTMAAWAAMIAGGALIVLAARSEGRRRIAVLSVAGFACFSWGALLRPDMASLAVPVFLLVGVPLLYTASHRRGPVLALGAALLVTVAGVPVNRFVYARTVGWEGFYEFNAARSWLTDYYNGERTRAQLAQLDAATGWSEVDLQLLRSWWMTDTDIYSTENIRKAAEILNPDSGLQRLFRLDAFTEAFETKAFSSTTLLTFAFLGIVALLAGTRAATAYTLLVIAGIGILIVAVEITTKSLPHRVYWPILAILLVFSELGTGRARARLPRLDLAIGMLALVVFGGTRWIDLDAVATRQGERREALQHDVANLPPADGLVYVVLGARFPYEALGRPLDEPRMPFRFLPLGLRGQTPLIQDQLRANGWEDLAMALCTDPRLRFISIEGHNGLVAWRLEHRNGLTVTFEPFFTGETFQAFRCHRTSAGPLATVGGERWIG